MKINAKHLHRAVSIAASALPSATIVPVQAYVCINNGTVTGIGPEMSVRVKIEPKSGPILVDPKQVLPVLSGISGDCELSPGLLVWGSGRLKFGVLDGTYPEMPVVKGKPVSVSFGDVAAGIKEIAPMVENKVDLDPFSYIWIHGRHVYGGTRNGFARYDFGIEMHEIGLSKSQAAKIGPHLVGDGTITVDGQKIQFDMDGMTIVASKSEASMPGFSTFFKKFFNDPGYNESGVKVDELKSALVLASSSIGAEGYVYINSEAGDIKFRCTGPEGFDNEMVIAQAEYGQLADMHQKYSRQVIQPVLRPGRFLWKDVGEPAIIVNDNMEIIVVPFK